MSFVICKRYTHSTNGVKPISERLAGSGLCLTKFTTRLSSSCVASSALSECELHFLTGYCCEAFLVTDSGE
ncbi:hypothetical protein ACET3Z_030643 [Daucus carota]